jgi:pyruvate dehydrogenase E2 component (dihydrolipoamide acetyltransferase)
MALEIKIPRLGWSMEEGNFVAWLKKDGELVRTGDALFSLEGEKATQDVESLEEGVLQITSQSPKHGEVVKVGQVIGHLIPQGKKPENDNLGGKEAQPKVVVDGDCPKMAEVNQGPMVFDNIVSTPVPNSASNAPTRRAISPRARRRAAELGVDITAAIGSGRTGRITEADVLNLAKAASPSTPSLMRRTIAHRTAASFASIPHFYLGCEFDATALLRFREDMLAEVEGASGVRLTISDLLLRAQALALRAHPQANAIWQDDGIVQLGSCDVGLVVGLPEGLMVPIVRSADRGDLATLARQRSQLVEDARAGRLTTEAMQGGPTSLSNLGASRVDDFSAVIAAPQSSMLAVGRAALRPCAFQERVALRKTIRLRLSVDHRVLDGAPAAEFLGTIVELLEKPERLTQQQKNPEQR